MDGEQALLVAGTPKQMNIMYYMKKTEQIRIQYEQLLQ
jgi:hypothetical protein